MAVAGSDFREQRDAAEVGPVQVSCSGPQARCRLPGGFTDGPNSFARTEQQALLFHSLHAGESVKTVYSERGEYVASALREIGYVLRDFHRHAVRPIDDRLVELLSALGERVHKAEPSLYRS